MCVDGAEVYFVCLTVKKDFRRCRQCGPRVEVAGCMITHAMTLPISAIRSQADIQAREDSTSRRRAGLSFDRRDEVLILRWEYMKSRRPSHCLACDNRLRSYIVRAFDTGHQPWQQSSMTSPSIVYHSSSNASRHTKQHTSRKARSRRPFSLV